MPGIRSSEPPSLQFFGAAGTVTGAKFLLRVGRRQVLLDSGLFQGLKALRLRNWQEPPFDPARLDAIVLSHAHLDHSGYLPLLVRQRFRGKIFCTSGTADLLRVMLLDSAHLLEAEAERANRHGYSKHRPALPLYTVEDAEASLRYLRPCGYGRPVQVTDGVTAVFRRAGHILGSATVELQIGAGQPFRLVYSGDLGRWDQPILRDPELVSEADILLLESTYGDRVHAAHPAEALARIVQEIAQRQGVLLIPAFTVGRTQLLIWMLRELESAGRIPALPVYIDSPMGINVADIYCRHPEDHDLDMKMLMDQRQCPLCCRQYHLVKTVEESKALNRQAGPMIVIAGSGMATGGRILHHLNRRLSDPQTTVLLVGFQAAGTRGRALQDGAATIRMFGQDVPVRARVAVLDGLSAHADRQEFLRWLRGFRTPPQRTYLVHGEPPQAQGLASTIATELGWDVRVAQDGERIDLVKPATSRSRT
ncbi:MAG: MBL fold metallo-hydrolase [Candidatus Omnitrophica bacterium CG11_big_fil_rev_8_21_14_0_20_63_9]|nr:MAG: MBL fold metallo-hydrolase [Candidatus Omnitrophica bacterium CG11_big_fil_rev_8_21_14_0_20_63_9]